MNMLMKRLDQSSNGIFSELGDEAGTVYFHTLEHAYEASDGFRAKITPGMYQCRRGKHRLHPDSDEFETFEITGVVGHSGLLFHRGNWEDDSKGCVLVGENRIDSMVTHSGESFAKFMALQEGCNEFTLRVV